MTPANSLCGTTADDSTNRTVVALSNGNYVVVSSSWDHGGIPDVGALTFGDGDTGVSGAISLANSLNGSMANDMVGNRAVSH